MKNFFILLLFLCGNLYGGQLSSRATGLLSLWHFNEGTGATTYDATLNNYNGTLLGGVGWVTGVYGYGLSFDKVDSRVRLTNLAYSSFFNNGNFTVMCWMKTTTFNFSERGTIMSFFNSNGNYGYIFCVKSNCKLDVYQVSDNYGNMILSTATWYHIAITISNKINYSMYINGILDKAGTTAAYKGDPPSTYFFIGGYDPQGTGGIFSGIIDEVSIKNRALSQGEIQNIYTSGLGRHSNNQ